MMLLAVASPAAKRERSAMIDPHTAALKPHMAAWRSRALAVVGDDDILGRALVLCCTAYDIINIDLIAEDLQCSEYDVCMKLEHLAMLGLLRYGSAGWLRPSSVLIAACTAPDGVMH
jgi:hypothetical protein